MKKKILICILPFLFTLTGCAQKFDYTPEQSAATAEYMAGLLLRYASNYSEHLLPEQALSQSEEETAQAAPTQTPVPTAVVGNEDTGAGPDKSAEDAKVPLKEASLSEVIGVPGFELQYKAYSLEAFYPKNATKEVFSITPRQGYQLAVVIFELTNKSSAKGEIELTSPLYQLNINQGVLYEPQLSLMENDLKYLDMKVAKGESKSVILIYEIKKDMEIKSMDLTATNDDKIATVKLK